jgi:hypothetical protein
MTLLSHPKTAASPARLGMRWLVLLVLALGVMVSSIGMTNSHGIALIPASHESAQLAAAHAPEHKDHDADHDLALPAADQGLGAEHPHHDLDHSHDTADHSPHALRASLMPRFSWDALVLGTALGQAFRRYRPPMA